MAIRPPTSSSCSATARIRCGCSGRRTASRASARPCSTLRWAGSRSNWT